MTNVMHFLENARLQVKSFPRNIKLKERLYLLSDLKIIWLSRSGGGADWIYFISNSKRLLLN